MQAYAPPCCIAERRGRPVVFEPGGGTPWILSGRACDEVGIVGARFRDELSVQVQAAVLSRRGRDAVRITGETGTGKELAAALCHRLAQENLGRTGELVEINCGNLPEQLFESTLFGHKRGAFTGAGNDERGLLNRAKGGTLVLDEVQNLSLEAQGRLLRLIGEREYRPVGGTELKRTDALILLVSNLDLSALAASGKFRRDLLDRAPAKSRSSRSGSVARTSRSSPSSSPARRPAIAPGPASRASPAGRSRISRLRWSGPARPRCAGCGSSAGTPSFTADDDLLIFKKCR